MPIATSTCITDVSLSAFSFEGVDVRVLNGSDEPWWVLADVCKVLEIRNSSDAANRLDEDEKSTITISDNGNLNASRTIINESGLYSLILTSRKPAAKRFKKWVTAEVLPAIRKTGGYMAAAPESRLTGFGTVVPQCLEASFNKTPDRLSLASNPLLKTEIGDGLNHFIGQRNKFASHFRGVNGHIRHIHDIGIDSQDIEVISLITADPKIRLWDQPNRKQGG